jgi:hypothetical protein
MPYKFFCWMVHQWFMRYNNFKYFKFFHWYFTKFTDIKFNRYFKLCFLILPLNCLFHGVMQCFSYAPLFLWSSSSSNLVATGFIYYHECKLFSWWKKILMKILSFQHFVWCLPYWTCYFSYLWTLKIHSFYF